MVGAPDGHMTIGHTQLLSSPSSRTVQTMASLPMSQQQHGSSDGGTVGSAGVEVGVGN